MVNKLLEIIKKEKITGGDVTIFLMILILLVFRIFNFPKEMSYEVYDVIVFLITSIYFISNYIIYRYVYKEKNKKVLLLIGIYFSFRLIMELL